MQSICRKFKTIKIIFPPRIITLSSFLCRCTTAHGMAEVADDARTPASKGAFPWPRSRPVPQVDRGADTSPRRSLRCWPNTRATLKLTLRYSWTWLEAGSFRKYREDRLKNEFSEWSIVYSDDGGTPTWCTALWKRAQDSIKSATAAAAAAIGYRRMDERHKLVWFDKSFSILLIISC